MVIAASLRVVRVHSTSASLYPLSTTGHLVLLLHLHPTTAPAAHPSLCIRRITPFDLMWLALRLHLAVVTLPTVLSIGGALYILGPVHAIALHVVHVLLALHGIELSESILCSLCGHVLVLLLGSQGLLAGWWVHLGLLHHSIHDHSRSIWVLHVHGCVILHQKCRLLLLVARTKQGRLGLKLPSWLT